MGPDLELVDIGSQESFKAWQHGYPFRTVRWHFHPEYELHHVAATRGHYFVGDFIGTFVPGNLVLTGPNLPHNWISDADAPLRSRIVQFGEAFVADAMRTFPELGRCRDMLEASCRGLLFPAETAATIAPMLAELVGARGPRRVELFIGILARLAESPARPLTSREYLPDPSGFMTVGINAALAYINAHLVEPFGECDLAELSRLTPSAFSRSFRRHTGMTLVQYVSRLRINLACQLLLGPDRPAITDVAFASGFNNLSNFNRHFLAQKGMPPTRFRALMLQQGPPAVAA